MPNTVIEVEDLAKQYRLGQVGRRTLSHDVNRWWYKLRGKEDPYLKIGQENDRLTKSDNEYVWALKDINFKVNEGEVLGIIGRNGAGKSTLLKILSKVTAPTKGQVKIRGRIASLLEVGTGFHPDLSGRENIFLNGAILGMTKKEIAAKFDEIVDFAGVERYIDTPVKRYSSGMYVRLAFAVAAHLEPDILIIDEVLAVGDAEFQKKCLGKMKDVSERDGRTVLFVSHNLGAVASLCSVSMLLQNGKMQMHDNTKKVLTVYNQMVTENIADKYIGNEIIQTAILNVYTDEKNIKTKLTVEIFFKSKVDIKNLIVGIVIRDIYNVALIGINNKHYYKNIFHLQSLTEGKIVITFYELVLLPGLYTIDLFIGDSAIDIEKIEDALQFSVPDTVVTKTGKQLDYSINRIYNEKVDWKIYTSESIDA